MTKECKQQFTLRITQANSTQLIVILYEMLLSYLEEGKAAHEAGDRAGFREAVRKMRGCLNELMRSLNLEYDIAGNLLSLYLYCLRKLAYGDVRNDTVVLDEVKNVIEKLHEAYGQVAARNEGGPVMKNTQTVYAGLTYGRNTLTENMTDQGPDRGLLV